MNWSTDSLSGSDANSTGKKAGSHRNAEIGGVVLVLVSGPGRSGSMPPARPDPSFVAVYSPSQCPIHRALGCCGAVDMVLRCGTVSGAVMVCCVLEVK